MDAAKRTPLYTKAGADGVYVEAVETTEEQRERSVVALSRDGHFQKALEGLKAGRAMRADDAALPSSSTRTCSVWRSGAATENDFEMERAERYFARESVASVRKPATVVGQRDVCRACMLSR
jgi:hypothetical protein